MALEIEHEGGIIPVVEGVSSGKAPMRTVVAACVGAGVAHLGTSTMPFQVGALMDGLGLSASAAGTFGFFEVGALSLSMLLVSPFIHRLTPARVAFTGALICLLAHVGLYFAPNILPLLYLIAAIAGAGYGLVFAAMVSGVAASGNADRVYAIANGGALVVIVALMAALPFASARFGALGPFLGIAILLGITMPAYAGFRNPPRAPAHQPQISFKQKGVLPLLAIWSAFSFGTGAVWSFAERIGHGLNVDAETIGIVLSASTFCGILGTGVAAAFSGRIARIPALLLGFGATACACLLLGFATGIVTFGLGVLMYWIFYMFLYSYLLGSAAALDPNGRIGTAGGGCERMGFALGAPLGGLLIEHFSFGAVGILGAVACVGLLPFCLPALRAAFKSNDLRKA